MNIETARDCFLDMMANAKWTENADAEIDYSGRFIDRTTHTLTVTDRDLAILADALGLDNHIYETTQKSIRRHIKAAQCEPAE